jgi:copper chaperone CopZ
MCKKRIETAVDVKGVKAADYNLAKKELELTYNPKKVDLAFLKEEILKMGYDVDSLRAPDEAYKKLDHCCQYDRNHKHGSHD